MAKAGRAVPIGVAEPDHDRVLTYQVRHGGSEPRQRRQEPLVQVQGRSFRKLAQENVVAGLALDRGREL